MKGLSEIQELGPLRGSGLELSQQDHRTPSGVICVVVMLNPTSQVVHCTTQVAVCDLCVFCDDPGLSGTLGSWLHSLLALRLKKKKRKEMVRGSCQAEAHQVHQKAKLQLMFPPDWFTKWAAACYQTDRQ